MVEMAKFRLSVLGFGISGEVETRGQSKRERVKGRGVYVRHARRT